MNTKDSLFKLVFFHKTLPPLSQVPRIVPRGFSPMEKKLVKSRGYKQHRLREPWNEGRASSQPDAIRLRRQEEQRLVSLFPWLLPTIKVSCYHLLLRANMVLTIPTIQVCRKHPVFLLLWNKQGIKLYFQVEVISGCTHSNITWAFKLVKAHILSALSVVIYSYGLPGRDIGTIISFVASSSRSPDVQIVSVFGRH